MNLYSDEHKQVLEAFIRHKVKFLLIGGFAAIYYGVNRNTGDIDILIEPSKENGLHVVEALKSLELEMPDFQPEEFEKKLVLAFGFPPDAVDILNETPGINFEEAYEKSVTVNLDNLNVRIIAIHDLIRNKESLQRSGEKAHLDQYDLAVLKKIAQNEGQ
jgi:hypothetical protein